MAQAVQLPSPIAPAGLVEPELTIYRLWYYNNPLEFVRPQYNVKVPIPRKPGPYYPLPLDKMQFPLTEWNIPILFESLTRRNLVWIVAEPTDADLKYAAYATLAFMYQVPSDLITSALMICIRLTKDQIEAAVAYGIGISLVPLVIQQ